MQLLSCCIVHEQLRTEAHARPKALGARGHMIQAQAAQWGDEVRHGLPGAQRGGHFTCGAAAYGTTAMARAVAGAAPMA